VKVQECVKRILKRERLVGRLETDDAHAISPSIKHVRSNFLSSCNGSKKVANLLCRAWVTPNHLSKHPIQPAFGHPKVPQSAAEITHELPGRSAVQIGAQHPQRA